MPLCYKCAKSNNDCDAFCVSCGELIQECCPGCDHLHPLGFAHCGRDGRSREVILYEIEQHETAEQILKAKRTVGAKLKRNYEDACRHRDSTMIGRIFVLVSLLFVVSVSLASPHLILATAIMMPLWMLFMICQAVPPIRDRLVDIPIRKKLGWSPDTNPMAFKDEDLIDIAIAAGIHEPLLLRPAESPQDALLQAVNSN